MNFFLQQLADSRFIRRVAQLTVYNFLKLKERFTGAGPGASRGFSVRRFIANFMENLQKELQNKK